ncbi:MAG: hypothetical protein QXD95_06390 [Nitrososphaeria archaeon]
MSRMVQIKGWFEANEIKDPCGYPLLWLEKQLNEIKNHISTINDVLAQVGGIY